MQDLCPSQTSPPSPQRLPSYFNRYLLEFSIFLCPNQRKHRIRCAVFDGFCVPELQFLKRGQTKSMHFYLAMLQTRKTAAELRQNVLIIDLKDSCPAVSQICILTLVSSSNFISLEQNSTPRVAVQPYLNSSFVNLLRRQLLPTPGGPMMIILKVFSSSFFIYLYQLSIKSNALNKYNIQLSCSYTIKTFPQLKIVLFRRKFPTRHRKEYPILEPKIHFLYAKIPKGPFPPISFIFFLKSTPQIFNGNYKISSTRLFILQMIASLQKRRNQSIESPYQNKFYLKRQHGNSAILSYQTVSTLKERITNKGMANSQTEDNLLKKRPTLSPHRFNQQLSVIQDRFSVFSSKIKTLLKNEHEGGKENTTLYQSNSVVGLTRSSLMKKAETQIKQYEERIEKPTLVPYFIECLKRKTLITTQACMHIHTSILTFKQYLKTVQHSKARAPDPKYAPNQQNRKTVVFDMDQTLIHTNEVMIKGYELKVPFKSVQGKIINGYVHVRPYAKEIIKNISKYFDVIVFTAGNQCYADPILDHLDPDKCIKHRLYRQSCTMVNCQLFVKDLRILGRKLENVVLVDNAPYSYMMQLGNGIPILNYLKGRDDDQLVRLEEYLMSLLNVEDVRTVNTETFRLKDYINFDNYDKLIYALYGKWM